MYYLLTGANPKPLTRSSPQLKSLDVSSELNHVVERATELELDRRYESVQWLKLDLDAIASSVLCTADVPVGMSCSSPISTHDIAPLLERLASASECDSPEPSNASCTISVRNLRDLMPVDARVTD